MEAKYKIGDYLQMVSERKLKESILANNKQRIPNSFGVIIYVVTGIIIESCYGGTQIHYRVRGALAEKFGNVGILKDLMQISEPELEPWQPEVPEVQEDKPTHKSP